MKYISNICNKSALFERFFNLYCTKRGVLVDIVSTCQCPSAFSGSLTAIHLSVLDRSTIVYFVRLCQKYLEPLFVQCVLWNRTITGPSPDNLTFRILSTHLPTCSFFFCIPTCPFFEALAFFVLFSCRLHFYIVCFVSL